MATPTKNEQTLIDCLFEILVRNADARGIDREQATEHLRDQLKILGFDTYAVGMSWGRLRSSPDQS